MLAVNYNCESYCSINNSIIIKKIGVIVFISVAISICKDVKRYCGRQEGDSNNMLNVKD